MNPTWLTTVPTVPPVGAGAPWFRCKYTATPGNFTTSKLPDLMAVPPIATKIFLLASMSRVLRCQCPMVTPASFGGNDCAQTIPTARVEIIHRTAISLFIAGSFFVKIVCALLSWQSQQLYCSGGLLPPTNRAFRDPRRAQTAAP